MATLTNTKIKDTYDGLLKLGDNSPLIANRKAITDGLGNTSGVSINNAGEMRVSDSQIVGDEPSLLGSVGVYTKTLMVGSQSTMAFNANVTNSIVSGQSHTVTGNNNLISGANTYVDGNSNVMGGNGNFTESSYNGVFGSSNTIQGNNTLASGVNNTVQGWNSIVSGNNNSIFGNLNLVVGRDNIAYASLGGIFGRGHEQTHDGQVVIGLYSQTENDSHVFRVGVGSGVTNRRNSIVAYNDTNGTVAMPTLQSSTSYTDDTAAAAGGVPIGGLYRNGSDVKIRIS